MNKVFLTGNVGKNPDIKTFDNGKVANVALATSERGYKLQNGTEVPDHTDWHSLVIRGGLVTVIEKFVHKGTKIAVVGKIRYRQYEANGQTRYATEIVVDDLELLSKSPSSSDESNAPAQPEDENAPF